MSRFFEFVSFDTTQNKRVFCFKLSIEDLQKGYVTLFGRDDHLQRLTLVIV